MVNGGDGDDLSGDIQVVAGGDFNKVEPIQEHLFVFCGKKTGGVVKKIVFVQEILFVLDF